MLNANLTLALTNAVDPSTMTTIALVVAALALLLSFVALSRSRRANGAPTTVDTAVTASPAQLQTAVSAPAGNQDHQVVAAISGALAAIFAEEQAAGAAPATTQITSIRRVGPASAAAAAAYTRTSSGPYAGFVVRRIRRV
jgi:hypothetical protein